jgi:hypothetical protein
LSGGCGGIFSKRNHQKYPHHHGYQRCIPEWGPLPSQRDVTSGSSTKVLPTKFAINWANNLREHNSSHTVFYPSYFFLKLLKIKRKVLSIQYMIILLKRNKMPSSSDQMAKMTTVHT